MDIYIILWRGSRKIAQLVKYLFHKHENPRTIFSMHIKSRAW